MSDRMSWFESLPAEITVTDAQGTIVEMNAWSRQMFAADGGAALVGSNVFDCHPEPSATKTRALFTAQKPSHYTIRKNRQKLMIHQLPWFINGAFAGFVEISVPIPEEMPHFDRG